MKEIIRKILAQKEQSTFGSIWDIKQKVILAHTDLKKDLNDLAYKTEDQKTKDYIKYFETYISKELTKLISFIDEGYNLSKKQNLNIEESPQKTIKNSKEVTFSLALETFNIVMENIKKRSILELNNNSKTLPDDQLKKKITDFSKNLENEIKNIQNFVSKYINQSK